MQHTNKIEALCEIADEENHIVSLCSGNESLLKQANILISQNCFDLAVDVLREAILQNPIDDRLYFNLGYCFFVLNKVNTAIRSLKIGFELNPHNRDADSYFCLGSCLLQQGEFSQAINAFQKAIEFQPNFALAYSHASVCLYELHRLDEAITYARQAINLQGDPASHYNLGRYLLDRGDFEGAIENYKRAIALKPNWGEVEQQIEQLLQCDRAGYASKIRQGYRVWDAILFRDNDRYLLYYLTASRTVKPFWSAGSMEAAQSTDLQNWQYLGPVLEPDRDREWESGRMLSGSVFKEKNIYYFFYSAASKNELLHERIGLATSVDGCRWQRRSEPFLESDDRYYGARGRNFNGCIIRHVPWRDPFPFKDFKTGRYYLFITSVLKSDASTFYGCIAVATSDRIDGCYEILPPAVCPILENTGEGIYAEMERPQVIYKYDRYHLFFSTSPKYINPKWLERVGSTQISLSSLYWYTSDCVTGPYVPSSATPVVKGSDRTGLYGTNFIVGPDGNLFACGCNRATMTLEVTPRFPVIWNQNRLEICIRD